MGRRDVCTLLWGKGIERTFGVMGAGLALASVLASTFLIEYIQIYLGANSQNVMSAMFTHPINLLFYALAIYEGYRFSFRKIKGADFVRLLRSAPDSDDLLRLKTVNTEISVLVAAVATKSVVESPRTSVESLAQRESSGEDGGEENIARLSCPAWQDKSRQEKSVEQQCSW